MAVFQPAQDPAGSDVGPTAQNAIVVGGGGGDVARPPDRTKITCAAGIVVQRPQDKVRRVPLVPLFTRMTALPTVTCVPLKVCEMHWWRRTTDERGKICHTGARVRPSKNQR